MMIRSDETEIRGRWQWVGFKLEADANAQRITALIREHLRLCATDSTGWETLYLDPTDGRFWELSYPEPDTHGGGPPMLRWLSAEKAKEKYGDAAR